MNAPAGAVTWVEEDDLRLLGRLLGRVISEAEGEDVFRLVERIRRLSVAFRRHSDPHADRQPKAMLGTAARERLGVIACAFAYFGHLANIADDREQLRAKEAERRDEVASEATVEMAARRLREAGVAASTVSARLPDFHVSTVLTAHPSEIRRKSVLDVEREISQVLQERDTIRERAQTRDLPAVRQLASNEAQLKARILKLWQTRLLRFTRLTVEDEIETALSYYEGSFLRKIQKSVRGSRGSARTPRGAAVPAGASLSVHRSAESRAGGADAAFTPRRAGRRGATGVAHDDQRSGRGLRNTG